MAESKGTGVGAFLRGAAAAFAVTCFVLGAAAWGFSLAYAGEPDPSDSASRVASFAPAVPTPHVIQPLSQLVGSVHMHAEVTNTGGTRALVIQLTNPTESATQVSCEVALERVSYGEGGMERRLLPPPTVTSLMSHTVSQSVGAGQTSRVVAPIDPALAGTLTTEGTTTRVALHQR